MLSLEDPIRDPPIYVWYLVDDRGKLLGRALSLHHDHEKAAIDCGSPVQGNPEGWYHSINAFLADHTDRLCSRLGRSVLAQIV